MALNKKERQQLKDLTHELRKAYALSWPLYSKPQPIPKEHLLEMSDNDGVRSVVSGWFYFTTVPVGGCGRIAHGCSDGVHHSTHNSKKTTSQGAGRLFGLRSEALKALRHELSHAFAKELANIDGQIIKAEYDEAHPEKTVHKAQGKITA